MKKLISTVLCMFFCLSCILNVSALEETECITGVEHQGNYYFDRKINFSDNVKKAFLNGNNIEDGTIVTKEGNYELLIFNNNNEGLIIDFTINSLPDYNKITACDETKMEYIYDEFLSQNKYMTEERKSIFGKEIIRLWDKVRSLKEEYLTPENNKWYSKYINLAFKNNIVVSDPNDYVFRYDALKNLINIKNIDMRSFGNVNTPFYDIYYDDIYLKTGYALGIIKGKQIDERLFFYGEEYIKRAEFFAMLGRIIKKENTEYKDIDLKKFSDYNKIEKYSWCLDDLKYLVYCNIIQGDTQNNLRLDDNITQAEMVKAIFSLFYEKDTDN